MQIERLEGLLANETLRNFPKWTSSGNQSSTRRELDEKIFVPLTWVGEISTENDMWPQTPQGTIARTSLLQITKHELHPVNLESLQEEILRLLAESKLLTIGTVFGKLRDWDAKLFPASGERKTTDSECLIAEFRGWSLLESNWDGEGASAPVLSSLNEAEAFVRMIPPDQPVPEPMLLPSGRAGLYWNDTGLYADLEFTGDGRIIYYIENEKSGKHKGVAKFNSKEMPPVFAATILVKKSR